MILLLGNTGYMGHAFEKALQDSKTPFLSLSRKTTDYTRFEILIEVIRKNKITFLINAAGYTGKPNVDTCETAWADTLQGNTLLPLTIAQACAAAGVPWGHVSSGCIFAGAKISENGTWRVEKDFSKPALKKVAEENPFAIRGFDETDEPNFSFRKPPCSFYSGTKAMGEEAIKNVGEGYIWRLRIPFDENDNGRNYLTKLQRYAKVYDNVNSLSHRADFVRACLELWQRKAPFGIYNVTNPGFVTSKQVVGMIETILKPARTFEFWESDEEFYRHAAKTPRSNCVMDVTKLLSTGVKMRPVQEALEDSLCHWQPENR
ncbi:MAG: dTDP-4-dehydrorhamnose reductase [Verrucomicrobiales bacterium]|nr:dTDP-4-dehydrorhamnose reductase [Verrucomicrobiales bacterium]